MKIRLFGVLALLLFPLLLPAQYFGEASASPGTWSVGIKASLSQLQSDVMPLSYGKQASLFFQKTSGRIIDLRIEFQLGRNYGQDLNASSNHLQNPALNGLTDASVNYDSSSNYFHNYQHSYGSLGLVLKININRIITVIGAEKWDLYSLGGFGIYGYETRINALNKQGNLYEYSFASFANQDILRERLESLLDDSYESLGEQDLINNTFIGPYALQNFFLVGGGFRYELSRVIAVGLEGSYTFFGDDLLDGQQRDEAGELSANRDKLISAGFFMDFSF